MQIIMHFTIFESVLMILQNCEIPVFGNTTRRSTVFRENWTDIYQGDLGLTKDIHLPHFQNIK